MVYPLLVLLEIIPFFGPGYWFGQQQTAAGIVILATVNISRLSI